MAKLVSDAAISTIRKFVVAGMQTSVDLYPRTLVETASDTQVEWETKSATVFGWLRTPPANNIGLDTGVLDADAPFRLLLPVGTAIGPGDQVRVNGDRYMVVDTNVESTYKTSLRCTVRKIGT